MSPKLFRAIFLIAFTLLLQSCGSQSGQSPELIVYCGAGIRPPIAELSQLFQEKMQNEGRKVNVSISYEGSEMLLGKIKVYKKGDVYIPGDKHYIEMAKNESLIESSKSLCYFVPVILTQKSNPKNIKSVKDLLKPGVRFGLGSPKACAIGKKSLKIFEKYGLNKEDYESNLVYQAMTVNDLGIQLKAGSLDAVIVWDALYGQYADSAEMVNIPVGMNVISEVTAGELSFSRYTDLSKSYMDFLASAEAKPIFKKHHYRTDAP
ncbi:MAG: substrate-binding domain-containing protein [Planctomycetes bacterium]|nr:substrate-binding domain-containing protein [Planctomycetota bacterium]